MGFSKKKSKNKATGTKIHNNTNETKLEQEQQKGHTSTPNDEKNNSNHYFLKKLGWIILIFIWYFIVLVIVSYIRNNNGNNDNNNNNNSYDIISTFQNNVKNNIINVSALQQPFQQRIKQQIYRLFYNSSKNDEDTTDTNTGTTTTRSINNDDESNKQRQRIGNGNDNDNTIISKSLSVVGDLVKGATIVQYYYKSTPSEKVEQNDTNNKEHDNTIETTTSRNDNIIHYNYVNAYTIEYNWTKEDDLLDILLQYSNLVYQIIPDIDTRLVPVSWGGQLEHPWWSNSNNSNNNTIQDHHGLTIDTIKGGRLLWSHYKIMRSYMKNPKNLTDHSSHFPFKFCKRFTNGCVAVQSIEHTLEFREQYQPWRVTDSMLLQNDNGFVYTRGFSPSSPVQNDHNINNYGRHSILFIRPGKNHIVKDGMIYYRCILHSIERAIAQSMKDSNERIGKFNVLIDGTDFEWKKVPEMAYLKQAITMLQDHYPNRLGMLFLTNMSRTAEFVVSLIKPLITKEVRDKIHILSHDPKRRSNELKSFIEEEYIPFWLNGRDRYQFDPDIYYKDSPYWTDEESRQFLQTMPYHALH